MTHKLLLTRWLRPPLICRNTAFKCKPIASVVQYSSMSQAEQKADLRRTVKQNLRKQATDDMARESQAIAQHVLQLPIFQRATTLGVYLHCAKLREVDTTLVVAAAVQAGSGKQCFVPLVEDQNANMRLLHLDNLEGLVPVAPFNIMEPKPTYQRGAPREDVLSMQRPLELLLMPGLAFDRQGHRLGRGGGYYDNFIRKCIDRAKANGWDPPLLVALAFEAQVVDAVPTAAHDIDVDILVMATNVIGCSQRGHTALLQTLAV